MKPDYFRTEKMLFVLERSRTTGNYFIRRKGTMEIWTLEAFAMAQENAKALIETLTAEDVENMAEELADKARRRQQYTCEACGTKHANEFSRTCKSCDEERESGELELPNEMTDEEKADQWWQSNTR